MTVAHISNSDLSGGAAIAAYRLHQGLCRTGIDSRMVVRRKLSGDESVVSTSRTPGLFAGAERRIRKWQLRRAFERYQESRPSNPEYFSSDSTIDPQALARALPPADVYNLHWVAHILDYASFFSRLPPRQPLVWTLHDMNPFTGGCHYVGTCRKFEAECGFCPALGATQTKDLSTRIFARKRSSYDRLHPDTVRFVAPSRWMADEARRSALLDRFEIQTIPNGLDAESFRPHDRLTARGELRLPSDLKLVMVASAALRSPRKGIDLLLSALNELPMDVALLTLGGDAPDVKLPRRHFLLGEFEGNRLLSLAYSAADVFVCPSREDNLPNVVMEAMACGTPVVGFDVGGISDMVRQGVTGLLAPPEDTGALARAIRAVLDDDAMRSCMAAESRKLAQKEYRLEVQAERYVRLYDELMENRRPKGGR